MFRCTSLVSLLLLLLSLEEPEVALPGQREKVFILSGLWRMAKVLIENKIRERQNRAEEGNGFNPQVHQ